MDQVQQFFNNRVYLYAAIALTQFGFYTLLSAKGLAPQDAWFMGMLALAPLGIAFILNDDRSSLMVVTVGFGVSFLGMIAVWGTPLASFPGGIVTLDNPLGAPPNVLVFAVHALPYVMGIMALIGVTASTVVDTRDGVLRGKPVCKIMLSVANTLPMSGFAICLYFGGGSISIMVYGLLGVLAAVVVLQVALRKALPNHAAA